VKLFPVFSCSFHPVTTMIIAVEGCAHGELEVIYETLAYLENMQKVKVDVLLCCGDFQVGS